MRREERQGILKVERREWIIPTYFNDYYSIPHSFSFLLIIRSVLPIILIIFFKNDRCYFERIHISINKN